MNTQFKVYFREIIEDVASILYKLNICSDKKEINAMALNIVEVEVLFSMVDFINKDFINEMTKMNNQNEETQKPLVGKLSDIRNLLYLNRLPHWNYLSFKGKVCNARLYKWFLQYSSNSVLIDRVHNYFDISKQVKLASNNMISFVPLITNEKYIDRMNTEVKENILNLSLFTNNGCELDIFENYLVQENISCPLNRLEIYKVMITKKLNPEPIFAKNEIKKIKRVVFDKKEDDTPIKRRNRKESNTKDNNFSHKEFKVKTSVGEFFINEEFRSTIADNYKYVIEKLESIQCVEKRDKVTINVTLDELRNAAKILDNKLGESRFTDVLNTMDFIDPKTQSRRTTLTFDGLCNMIGMVNTGKTTFMVISAVALIKKGYKVGLVLRDNDDAFQQYKALLSDVDGILPVPILGQSSKKTQAGKVLTQNIENSKDLEEANIFKDTLYEFVTYTCPLKASLIDYPDDNKDVFSSLNDREDLLCNSFYCNDEKITCPFVYNCDSVLSNERILDGNVFLTNSYSFAQTSINKYFVEGERRISEFLYDSCDLVLFDESDIVQFIDDSSFVSNSSVYNDDRNPSIIENIDSYFQSSQGNAMFYAQSIDLLNGLSVTRMNAFNILKMLTSNMVPSTISKSPINSKSIYGFLSWLLVREVDCIKTIAKSTVNLNLKDVKDFSDENFDMNNDNYKLLVTEFKNIANYIYSEYKKEFIGNTTPLFDSLSLYSKDTYGMFSFYLNLTTNQPSKSRIILEAECLKYIFDTKLCNDSVVEIIKENQNIKNMVLDILSFALILNRLECDLMQIMNNAPLIQSTLYKISDSNIEDIPAIKGYIKDYKDVLSKCPLDMSIGLKYDKEQQTLSSVVWSNVGRELIYNYSDLWKYVRGDENSGVNIALLSGTSYMPSSPLYHIEKPVNYLIRTKKDKNIDIKFLFAPEKDENGQYIYNSGINKSTNGNGFTIYKNFAKAFCRPFKNNPTKLDFYLKEYTKPGRNRMLISVGTYEHALMLANYIYEIVEHIQDSNVKVACLIRDNETNTSDNLSLPNENRLKRQSIKDIENTPFNIVVVPQTALQRGINMVGYDITSEISSGKKVASFSCVLKTNRDYQIPNSNEYAVARVHHKLNKLLKEATEKMDISYDLDKFVKNSICSLNTLYDEYYTTKYFADLSEEEREMIIADLCVEDFQFIGRIIRGDSDACVIMADASFFRAYTKDGSIDTEKTSTIVAIKWLMERLKEKDAETAFIIEELYSPFLNGIYEMLNNMFKS